MDIIYFEVANHLPRLQGSVDDLFVVKVLLGALSVDLKQDCRGDQCPYPYVQVLSHFIGIFFRNDAKKVSPALCPQ